ncbi:DUF4350 domain-containing protein [Pseudofrankia inefficax]|uniref:DUF4350 domain-containing protein n=1 Tax=Pseudofrankia inefficax (strain DSM 45817 / CECT 9037 / DDB 130130 / EuI1c) TaxID=298654 RepID=E3J0W9_PSEI1|nr:DUF4350 domain-containing protein [Pseudofrankia inefficax]ADP84033.1 hypothetical protein FraEuI1c_6049 [Pseudofrankia inefficax]
MTAPADLAPEPGLATPAGSTFQPTAPRPASRRRLVRVLAVFAALAVVYGVIAAFIGGSSDGDTSLDTTSPRPNGTMALAQILGHRGVTVRAGDDVATALDQSTGPVGTSPERTFVIVHPGRLSGPTLSRLSDWVAGGADVVLVEPDTTVLDALRLPVRTVDAGATIGPLPPGCPLAEATAAGTATISPSTFYGRLTGDTAATATFCYRPTERAAALVVARPAGGQGRFVLLGGSAFLTNRHLDQDGNAALALGLLVRHPDLEWVIQRRASSDPVDGKGAVHLLGPGFWLTCLQLLIGLVLLALWRGRRLGPPVPEPLPVVVRAAETTEGRGRLYAAARARDLAAEALRAGLRARLADRMGVAPHGERGAVGTVRAGGVVTEITGPDPGTLVASVAERTGRPAMTVWTLLYGSGGPAAPLLGPGGSAPFPGPGVSGGPLAVAPEPPELDDAALLRLAEALDDLERQVGGR